MAIREAIGCPIYYHNIDDRAGKARRMRELIEGKHQVISATNTLGLGVDIPDIRVVIHVGQPRKLRDYAQESGWAGKDKESSKAIIVCGQVKHVQRNHKPQSWARSQGEDIIDFVAGYNYRRVVMDRVIDGRMDRIGCEEGEEQYDVC